MPGKWGGAHQVHPPRSANELGCQANGGRAPGAPPPRSANDQGVLNGSKNQVLLFTNFGNTVDVSCGSR